MHVAQHRPAAPPVDRHAQAGVDQRNRVGAAGLGRLGDVGDAGHVGRQLGDDRRAQSPRGSRPRARSHIAGSVPKSTPPLTRWGRRCSARPPRRPAGRRAARVIATNSSCVRPAMLTMIGAPSAGQIRQVVRDEGLDAVVVEADRVEHAGGGFDRSPRRVAGARLGGDRLGQDAAEPARDRPGLPSRGRSRTCPRRPGSDWAAAAGRVGPRGRSMVDVSADGMAATKDERIASSPPSKFGSRSMDPRFYASRRAPQRYRPCADTFGRNIAQRLSQTANCLDDAAVRTDRRHVARLVEEPDPLPFVEEVAQVFGREDQLLGAPGRIGRVHRNQAAGVDRQHPRHGDGPKYLTHPCVSSVSSRSARGASWPQSRTQISFRRLGTMPARFLVWAGPATTVFDKSGEKRRENSQFIRLRREQSLIEPPKIRRIDASIGDLEQLPAEQLRRLARSVPMQSLKLLAAQDFRLTSWSADSAAASRSRCRSRLAGRRGAPSRGPSPPSPCRA